MITITNMKKSISIKILEAMDNWQVLSNVELSKIAGWRFWGYLYNLRQAWVVFEKTKWEKHLEYWSLEEIPDNVKYKGRNSLKIIKLSLLDRISNLMFN